MRETMELSGAKGAVSVARLREAARFELDERSDATMAERHLALALRLAPSDADVAAEYRRAAQQLDERRNR
jgi:hypothetical protein